MKRFAGSGNATSIATECVFATPWSSREHSVVHGSGAEEYHTRVRNGMQPRHAGVHRSTPDLNLPFHTLFTKHLCRLYTDVLQQ